MKQFIYLTAKESKGLDSAIYENAVSLNKDALLLAKENKSFNSATSLLILSSEELIKAILVLLHSEGYEIYKMPDAKLFFKNHEIRHGIAKLVEMGYGLFEASEIWEKQKEKPIFKKNVGFWGELFNDISSAIKAVSPLIKTTERIKKLQEFNDLKNKGLYVDFRNDLMAPRLTVDENEYHIVKEIVNRIFKFYEKLKELFELVPQNAEEIKMLENTKLDLRIFIDDALKDFSVSELNKLKIN